MPQPTLPTDLTKRPPRGARCRLGGFAILPRIIDKGRAVHAGTNGEYNYACPLDMQFFEFAAVDPKAFKKQIDAGLGDGDLLAWIKENSGANRRPHEVALWSRFMEDRIPSDIESREFFHGAHKATAASREDIGTWFDLLDLDDYASFGGKV
ncbi:MAG: DUF5069 domain-containing protein [Chthoniobacterales bacterium]|nr:DUF5069 domain-containing protein [Chthoniobacterales bacterium]